MESCIPFALKFEEDPIIRITCNSPVILTCTLIALLAHIFGGVCGAVFGLTMPVKREN